MTNRLLVGALASAAALCLALGRTQVAAASVARPARVPIADHVDPSVRSASRPTVTWPLRVSDRMLEVLYVFSNRTPSATRGGRIDSLSGRDERS